MMTAPRKMSLTLMMMLMMMNDDDDDDDDDDNDDDEMNQDVDGACDGELMKAFTKNNDNTNS